jgi:hypothetical protein
VVPQIYQGKLAQENLARFNSIGKIVSIVDFIDETQKWLSEIGIRPEIAVLVGT